MEYKFVLIERDTRETLKESLETEEITTLAYFIYAIDIAKIYEFYGYDERCHELLWCLKQPISNLPWWLGIRILPK